MLIVRWVRLAFQQTLEFVIALGSTKFEIYLRVDDSTLHTGTTTTFGKAGLERNAVERVT